MVRTMDEITRLVPRELNDAVYSLGATRWETSKVILRQVAPGILTAILLSFGRGIGDAACVLFTAGYTDNIPTSLNEPAATLPLAIFFQLSSPIEEVQGRAYASTLILTVIVLFISILSRIINRMLSRHKIQ
jgi:phosphate transport system permease protein